MNKVLTLTTDAFEEEIVSRIAPDTGGRYPTGLHTLGSGRPNDHRREPLGICRRGDCPGAQAEVWQAAPVRPLGGRDDVFPDFAYRDATTSQLYRS